MPGPDEAGSEFPSNSSSGLEDCVDGGLGSFEGWVGLGSAKKYGWFRAYRNGHDEQELECFMDHHNLPPWRLVSSAVRRVNTFQAGSDSRRSRR